MEKNCWKYTEYHRKMKSENYFRQMPLAYTQSEEKLLFIFVIFYEKKTKQNSTNLKTCI